ncbi:hypothetical protein [Lacipirellula limnantheis]|uniref:Uncharacterized protein n=1 Tax=Lacipirellula limnantheis TaxID=2528024 RepID=A0A517TZB8_9BACT|nr:hypothetical protein [Lacipirellula limnantheis]QDT73720.1 hypothetical protein I41_29110 [Lacipirellula limnantheis]
MHFTIRQLLLLTFLGASLFVPLAKPSLWWALSLPTIGAVVATYALARVMSSKEPGRLFWTTFLGGVATYLALVLFVGFFAGSDVMRRSNIWDDYLGRPAYKLLHGESAFITNRQGLRDADFTSFLLWFHIVCAVVVSSTASFVIQLITLRRTSQPNRLP